MHYFLYIKARNEEFRREAERSRQRREARDVRRGR
jgi:hypothetical protein